MDVRLTIKEKYLKIAAGLLAIMASDEDYERKVEEAKKKCENAVVEVNVDDFKQEETKQLSIALAMYALGKFLVEDDDEALELERKRKAKK